MKTRIIQSRFWDDNFINESNYLTRYIYIYLLTSQYINICGIFQLPVNKILFETGITRQQFAVAQKELEASKKVFFVEGWVYVANARKNNHYENSEFNALGCQRELDKVPESIVNTIKLYLNSSMDSTIDSSNKQEIIDNKYKTVNKYMSLDSVDEELMKKLSEHYGIRLLDVKKTYDAMYLWSKSKGKVYKDYKAGLMNWIARRLEEGKIKSL